jgi:ribosomal protein L17
VNINAIGTTARKAKELRITAAALIIIIIMQSVNRHCNFRR